MATPKKTSSAKKATAPKTSSKSKTAAKPSSKSTPGSREEKLAEQALKLVDEAAGLLRSGIRTGASETHKTRLAAKRKAHTLLTRASSSLSQAVESGTESLQKVISKL